MTERWTALREGFLARADHTLGPGYSAVLYGSTVRGDFISGRSDCNLLVVADRLGPAELRTLGPALAPFERECLSPPLLFLRQEWTRAADVFPIEITDMRSAYRVLREPDPLADLVVRPADLRHALESELRGKLLRLRVDYALYGAKEEQLAAVVGASIGSLRVLFRAFVVLAGRDSPPDDAALVRAVEELAGVPAQALAALLTHRRDAGWRCSRELFEAYLEAVNRVVQVVDTLSSGE
jgi:hypothetical protein